METTARLPIHKEIGTLVAHMRSEGVFYDEALRMFKRAYLRDVLIQYRGNQCGAADALGVHRNTLSRAMAELGLTIAQVRKAAADRVSGGSVYSIGERL